MMATSKRPLALMALFLIGMGAPIFAGWDEGVAAFKKGNFSAAAQEFRAILTADGSDHRAHYLLGLSLGAVGKKPDALRHVHKARDLAPSDPAIRRAARELSPLSGEPLQATARQLGEEFIDLASRRATRPRA